MRTWTCLPLTLLLLACGDDPSLNRVPGGLADGQLEERDLPEVRDGFPKDDIPTGSGSGEREGPDDRDPPEPPPEDCREPNLDDCEFTTYNLEVEVGDRFRVSNFLDCDALVGVDYFFEYEDGETWNLDALNADEIIEITAADEQGGNHGEGRYRFNLVDASGEELDHMTIRIEDKSDIRAGDVQPNRPAEGLCSEEIPDDGATPIEEDNCPEGASNCF